MHFISRREMFCFVYILTIICLVQGAKNSKPKIAIIGGGIAGASTSYFLSELFGENGADISVYEKDRIGGRLAKSEIANSVYETGGSGLISSNKYMKNFVKILGLQAKHVYGIRMGLYDGKKYLIMEGDRSVNSYGTLFHRYGDSLSNWHTVVDDVLNRFLKIYQIQKQGYAFSTVGNLMEATDPLLANLTQVSLKQFLLTKGLLPLFVNEIVTGITRICYGQQPTLHAFAGSISMQGAKAGLWGVRGGNDQVPKLLIEKSYADTIMEKVTTIIRTSDNRFEIESEDIVIRDSPDKQHERSTMAPPIKSLNRRTYDMVIVAAPQVDNSFGIRFETFPDRVNLTKVAFNHSATTLVSGRVSTSFLETRNKESSLDEILTISENPLFNSLTRVYPVDQDEEWNVSSGVWKLITERPLAEEDLDLIFSERHSTVVTEWQAYPHYTLEPLSSFVLHPGIFYTNSIEWAASSVEMSAISGKNAALLAYYHWTEPAGTAMVDSYQKQRDEL